MRDLDPQTAAVAHAWPCRRVVEKLIAEAATHRAIMAKQVRTKDEMSAVEMDEILAKVKRWRHDV